MRPDIEQEVSEHIAAASAMTPLVPRIDAVADLLCATFAGGGTVYTCGNGGSAADAQHLTGELIGHYRRDRRPLRAVTLSTDPTTITCIANDYSYTDVFARQVAALIGPGDVLVAFTTSGRSANVVRALEVARSNGGATVLCGGGDGGPALVFSDHALLSPTDHTPRVQEIHTLIVHLLSEVVDEWAYRTEAG